MRQAFCLMSVLGLLLSNSESAQAAPQQLLNKTIHWSYTVQSMQRDPQGNLREQCRAAVRTLLAN